MLCWIPFVNSTVGTCQYSFPNVSDNQTSAKCLYSCLYENGTTSRSDCYVEDCTAGCHINNISIQFEQDEYSTTVSESTHRGTHFLTVRLIPVGWTVSVNFEVDTETDKFSVDESGNITLIDILDREAQGIHFFRVHAKLTRILGIPVQDSMFRFSRNIAKTTVAVTVEDANDHPPKFTSSQYKTAILRNEEVGIIVLRMAAVDGDATPKHRDLSYSLEASSLYPLPFTINASNGALTLTEQLTEDDYMFRVVVTDGQFTATTDVIVEVVVDAEGRCEPNQCQPSGRCVPKQGSFDCVCRIGFTGLNCQRLETCSSDSCTLDNGR